MRDDFLTGGKIQASNRLFNTWNQCGAGTELVNTKSEQQRGEFDVTGQFATNADPDSCCVGSIHDGLQDPDDGRIRGVMEMRNPFIATIDGHQVLEEIVGPNAEKLYLVGENICHQSGAWDLDHDTEFHVLLEGNASSAELIGRFGKKCLGVIQLLDT